MTAGGISASSAGQALRLRRWAHRGAGKTAPENTLAAIREGASRGFTAVEFDTMPTVDGHWILHHDWVTGRTLRPRVGNPGDDSTGPSQRDQGMMQAIRIVNLSAADLARFEAGSWMDDRFAGEPVPSLHDALDLCARLRLEVNVELKLDLDSGRFSAPELARTAASLLQVLSGSAYAGSDRIVVSSFGLDGLYALRAAGYAGRIAPLFEQLHDGWVAHARDLQAEAIHAHHSALSPEWVRRIHTTGRSVRVYTVNDLQRLHELDAMGVDDVFTDNMDFASV